MEFRVQLSPKRTDYTKPFVIVLVFYLFSSLCSDAGQDICSEETNREDDQDERDDEVNECDQDLTKLEGCTANCH